jgi:hypothetical protein
LEFEWFSQMAEDYERSKADIIGVVRKGLSERTPMHPHMTDFATVHSPVSLDITAREQPRARSKVRLTHFVQRNHALLINKQSVEDKAARAQRVTYVRLGSGATS